MGGHSVADLKEYAEFEAVFPDPEWERGADDYPAGRPIAVWLRDQLALRGFQCSDVEEYESFGWAFYVTVGRSDVFCLLQGMEPWLLISELNVGLRDMLSRKSVRATYAKVLEAIAGSLAAEPRVRVSGWFTRAEHEERDRRHAEEVRRARV